MPYVIRPPVRKMSLALAFAAAVICAALAPSLSQADDDDDRDGYSSGCPDVVLSQPFAQFGDYADYSLVREGHFEPDPDSWSLSRSDTVDGNEPWFVRSASDDESLQIRSNGSATSGRFCVDHRYPHFRFFARHTGGLTGLLMVRARWTENDDTEYATLGFLSGSDFGSWAPTAMLPLYEALRLTDRRETQHVKLVFTALSGTWQIDDVYVDPYRR